jgi:hypothetical protein
MSKMRALEAAREAVHTHYCGATEHRDCPKRDCEGSVNETELDLIFEAIMGVYFGSKRGNAGADHA